MRPQPGPARDPRQRRRHRRPDLRREVSLARVGARAALCRIHPERLEHLSEIVAFTSAAPAQRHVIPIDSPGAGDIESGLGGGLQARLPREPQVVILVLLLIAHAVPNAYREPAPLCPFPILAL